jgi:phasin family protein
MFNFSSTDSPAAKAHFQSQYSMLTEISKQMFTAVQKINELNIQVAQTLLEETFSGAQQVLSAKDPQEALSIIAGQTQPGIEKLRAYQQHLRDIAAGTQAELAKTAETYIPQTARTAEELAGEVARRASEETEKAAERQRATMEKLIAPVKRPGDAGAGKGVH